MVEVEAGTVWNPGNLVRVHDIMNSMKWSCPCQETKTGSSLDLPARQWPKTYVQINTKMDN